MSRRYSYLITCLLLLIISPVQADQGIWQEINSAQRQLEANSSTNRYFQANHLVLKDLLDASPDELSGDKSHLVELPMPDGSLARFAVVESSIMEAELAAEYPPIKTYKAYGIDDPSAGGRLSYTPKGFGGMLYTAQGRIMIDADGQPDRYVIRSRPEPGSAEPFQCGAYDLDNPAREKLDAESIAASPVNRVPGSLITYRLAVAATNEYVLEFPDPPATPAGTGTTTEIINAINRVNVFYERDLGIRLLVVANNSSLYEIPDNGVLTNNSGTALIGQVQNWIDTRLPAGNGGYDIGHVFSTGGGGLAFIGSACDNANKAKGVTGLSDPTGDKFYVDFVAHEIGHQFNADHTFNGTTSSCGGFNRNQATAYEPGSGSTIMAYANICGAENLQSLSETTFHAGSIAQINSFVAALPTCGSLLSNGNSDPTITPGPDYTIPVNTPFVLDNNTAVDGGNPLSYQWDQMNAGTATSAQSFGTDLGDNALFRSYQPRALVSSRHFPSLATQLNNNYDKAEVLPCKSRAMDFRLTVRDDMSGQVTDDVRVTSTTLAGPFRVTSQSTAATISFSDPAQTVTWNPANSASPPVNCANVNIDLLAFNTAGSAYRVEPMLVGGVGVPNNNGMAIVKFPDISNLKTRVRVSCSDNIFYDISDEDINVVGSNPVTVYDNPVFAHSGGTVTAIAPGCPVINAGVPVHDSGALSYWWLLLLGGMSAIVKLLRLRAGSWS